MKLESECKLSVRERDQLRRSYQKLTPEQKLARSRKNSASRIAKLGVEEVRRRRREYEQSYRTGAEAKRKLRAKAAAYILRNPEQKMLYGSRERASDLGIEHSITRADIKIPTHCPVLGMKLSRGCGKLHDASPTLDRVDPKKGYIPGNVAVISLRANRIKQNATAEELEAIAAWMRSLEA